MGSRSPLAQRADRAALADLQRELAELEDMTVGELAQKYLEVFETPTRTRNKQYLRKHIAWRIQERADGGLSPRALDRIQALAPQAPARWRRPLAKQHRTSGQRSSPRAARADPRLPPIGSVVTRVYAGVEHAVTVLAKGFEYRGARYRSLSKIALLITGSSWNGFVFFFGRGTGGAAAPASGAA
jgi:hypothetical protein